MTDKFNGMPHLREPSEETTDFPGLVIHDGRVTGSITAGHSRLPLWAFVHDLALTGWDSAVASQWEETYITKEQMADFLYFLLEQRGDFGRLLCVLADVEFVQSQAEEKSQDPLTPAWWQVPEARQRVREALRRCLDALSEE